MSYYPEKTLVTDQDVWNAIQNVLDDEELRKEMGDNQRLVINEVRSYVSKNIRKIKANINQLIQKNNNSNKELCIETVEQIYDFLDNTTDNTIRSAFNDYYKPVPVHAFKYVAPDYAEEMISNGWVKCGTTPEYRKSDQGEMRALLARTESSPDIYEKIMSRMTNQILESHNISFEDVVKKIDSLFTSFFYICCVTDQEDSKHMWDTYGKNEEGEYGICMEVRIDAYPFHYITYDDMPVDSKYVLDQWNDFCRHLPDESPESVCDNYLSLSKGVLSIGLLNMFRKDVHNEKGDLTTFPEEHEIRYLMDKNQLKSKINKETKERLYFLKCEVIRVISDISGDIDENVRILCHSKNIRYERRRT